MKKLLLILLCLPMIGFGQSWNYSSGGNDFDGEYRISSIIGVGDDYPYNSPKLVINCFVKSNQINFYIANGGYFFDNGTSDYNTEVLISFNNEKGNIYTSMSVTSSRDGKNIFLGSYFNTDTSINVTQFEIFKKLMVASYVNIRIKNNHGQNDMRFSLSGSTKALNYVIPDFEKLMVDSENKAKLSAALLAKEKELAKAEEIIKQQEVIEKARVEANLDSTLNHLLSNFLIPNPEINEIKKEIWRELRGYRIENTVKELLDIRIERVFQGYYSFDRWEVEIMDKNNVETYIDYLNKEDAVITRKFVSYQLSQLQNILSNNFLNTLPIRVEVIASARIDKKHVSKTFSILLDSDMINAGITDGGWEPDQYHFSSDGSEKNISIYYEGIESINNLWEKEYRTKNKIARKYSKASLEYYSNIYYEKILKNKNNKNVIWESKIFNGIEFFKLEWENFEKSIGKEVVNNLYIVKGEEYFYKILTLNSLDRKSEFSPMLEKIVKSFRLEN